MKSKDLNMKNIIIVILVTVFSFWVINNFKIIGNILKIILNVMMPFIIGGVIAFILNIPMSKIEKLLKKKIRNKDGLVRTISITLSLMALILVLSFIALLIVPLLVDNIKNLIDNVPLLVENTKVFVLDLLDKYPDIQQELANSFNEATNWENIISNILTYLVNGAMGFISSLVSGFITFFTGIIFAIYMLSQKEYLIRISKKIVYSILDESKAKKVIEIGSLANRTFNKFILGQCSEAVILGFIMFIVCTLCRFPYALIIAVLTTITALIPIFGAFIAAGVGVVLIAISNPLQALCFIIVFLIIQQIEGNFIYPHVVGASVELSPMCTLFAAIIGGNLFGIVGMLLGLPIASILYAVIKNLVNNRLEEKKIKVS